MKISSLIVAVSAVVALGAGVARADIPPADACTSPGQPCQNAGPTYDQAGVCTSATCTKTIYNGPGDLTTMPYACNQCQAGGAGGAGGTGTPTGGVGGASSDAGGAGGTSEGTAGAGGTTAGAGGQPALGGPSKVAKSSGCAVAGSGDGASAAVLLLLALAFARRGRTNG